MAGELGRWEFELGWKCVVAIDELGSVGVGIRRGIANW